DPDRAVVRALDAPARLPAVLAGPERVDPAVAEVPDEQVAAELAEGRRRHRHPPRGVEIAECRDASHEVAVEVELVDDAKTLAVELLLAARVLLGVGHEDRASDRLDVER